MLFRTDTGAKEAPDARLTKVGLATSVDGINWQVDPEPVFDQTKMREWLGSVYRERFGPEELFRIYDPRLTIIDDEIYLCFALDTIHGVRGGIAKSTDFRNWNLLHITLPDNRNMVLFPERVNGNLVRLERPFPIVTHHKDSFDIWISESPDGVHWGNHQLLLAAHEIPFGNTKCGPGAPPIKTEKGWLTTFHSVYIHEDKQLYSWDRGAWHKEYMAGLLLLDLNEPWKIIGMSQEPLLRASEPYELEGFRGSVIFPGGFLLEEDKVKMFYGAADTTVALAEGKLEDLLAMIQPM